MIFHSYVSKDAAVEVDRHGHSFAVHQRPLRQQENRDAKKARLARRKQAAVLLDVIAKAVP